MHLYLLFLFSGAQSFFLLAWLCPAVAPVHGTAFSLNFLQGSIRAIFSVALFSFYSLYTTNFLFTRWLLLVMVH